MFMYSITNETNGNTMEFNSRWYTYCILSESNNLSLERLSELLQGSGRDTVVDNDGARSGDNLTRLTVLVDLAETAPLTEVLSLGDGDERDVLLSAESSNDLLVSILIAVIGEDGNTGTTGNDFSALSFVSLGNGSQGFVEAALDTTGLGGDAQNLLEVGKRACSKMNELSTNCCINS